jgi:hypothetical protein
VAAEKVDRRVRRTRELLRRALLEAILEKGYERITVLFYGLEELQTAFDPAAQDPRRSPTLKVFEHFHASREVWQAMVGRRGAEAFSRQLHHVLADLLRSHLRTRAPQGQTQVPLEAVVEFATSTLIGLGARWWLEQDTRMSPREMDQLYRRLTEPGIRAALRPVT